MKEKIYQFTEPHITGGDCVVTITEKQILKYQHDRIRNNIKAINAPDKDLIDDFIIMNWCTEVKGE